jgi:hypothetical protein
MNSQGVPDQALTHPISTQPRTQSQDPSNPPPNPPPSPAMDSLIPIISPTQPPPPLSLLPPLPSYPSHFRLEYGNRSVKKKAP